VHPFLNDSDPGAEVNRRQFLQNGSFTTLMALAGGIPVGAAESPAPADAPSNPGGSTDYQGKSPTVKVGLVGCGLWGREILRTLSLLANAPVVALCDTYANHLKRASSVAPDARSYGDYRAFLEDPQIEAVMVATPSHRHREIVLAALDAGKHVYCEAPIATTIEDARAIARAARDRIRLNFQAGLQSRADKQIVNLANFLRLGVLGRPLKARQQFHHKTSWRRTAPDPEVARQLNWRLERAHSLGLVGELGVHPIDLANWFFLARPLSVSGFGSLVQWKDGRDVPDNIQARIEYPGGVFLSYEATVGNSFEPELGVLFGTDSAILMRDRRAWMFKEADAPLLGWEIYARRDAFYKDSGIVLGAGASKLAVQEPKPASPDVLVDEKTALQYALEAFLINSHRRTTAIQDFSAAYDAADTGALEEYLADLEKTRLPAAGWREGFESAVTVIGANEAVLQGAHLTYDPAWFELG